jgi:hypothetical protein
MRVISQYWKLVRLGTAGNIRIDELPSVNVQKFFQQKFPLLQDGELIDHGVIQNQLLTLMHHPSTHERDRTLAELSLRCFISHQIEQVCIQLEKQFGQYYGFRQNDLFAFVLDDDGRVRHQESGVGSQPVGPQGSYQPLAVQILQKFDPERASLATWTTRLVKQHHELNAFLLERGLCMLSDWAILNDTTVKKLQRVLTEFHHLTASEVEQASLLLDSYHAVYRRDRILQGQKGACQTPTSEQLQAIRDRLPPEQRPGSPAIILTRLQTLADRLRQHRISTRGGKLPGQSLDSPEMEVMAERLGMTENPSDEDPQIEFLQTYRQQFVTCLEQALVAVVDDRLQALKPPKAQSFLSALQKFYCDGMTMTAIAHQIGWKAQSQVTRLLQLNAFRADVRHWMLQCLRSAVQNSALNYVAPEQLVQLDHRIETALQDQVDALMQTEMEIAHTPRSYAPRSLFARRLCQYLDSVSI